MSTIPHFALPTIRNVSLKIDQKRQVCVEAERRRLSHETATVNALADWALTKFGSTKLPNRTTITRILHSPPLQVTTHHRRIEKSVRNRQGNLHALEIGLYH